MPGATRSYVVRIHYIELVGGTPCQFVSDFHAEAGSDEEARQMATSYFDRLRRDSAVGWNRRVERIEVMSENTGQSLFLEGDEIPASPSRRRTD